MAKSEDKRQRTSVAVTKGLRAPEPSAPVVIPRTSDMVRRLVEDTKQERDINARFAYYEEFYKGQQVPELAAAMVAVENAKEYLEAVLKCANAELDTLRMKCIPAAADDAKLDTPIRIAGIGRISLLPDLFVHTKSEEVPKLYAWFRKNKLSDIIKETINPSTLKAWIKDRIKAGKSYPSELLTVTPITKASITREAKGG